MDFFRNDELLPVWNHDDENEYSTSPGSFEGFWPITGTTSDEDNSASSDAMFVDSSSSDQLAPAQSFTDNFVVNNGYSSSSESFSASTEDFTQLQLQEQQAQQQYQLEQMHLQQLHQLQQYQFQQQQQLQYQTQYVPMGYQYAVPQQQYYPVEAQQPVEYYQQQPQQEEYYQQQVQQPQEQAQAQPENYEEDVQYDNAYEDDDEQYDDQYEEQTPSSVSSPSAGFVGNMEVDSDPVDFKLPASKTPIMEAMVVCALNGWGLAVVKSLPNEVVFRVNDFDRYYRVSRAICSKHRPTDDVGSRVKTLRRWFVNFPKKKDRQENPSFLLAVKPNTCKKVHGIIERNVKLMTGSKRSSR